jgi:hypothetical protein
MRRLKAIAGFGLLRSSRPIVCPAVFKDAFDFFLVPPSPRGVWGGGRIVIFQRQSWVLGRLRPESGGTFDFNFYFDLMYGWVWDCFVSLCTQFERERRFEFVIRFSNVAG